MGEKGDRELREQTWEASAGIGRWSQSMGGGGEGRGAPGRAVGAAGQRSGLLRSPQGGPRPWTDGRPNSAQH